ncbi:ATP-binding protein [Corallococcus sicarius]|uniref:ATP-binding protein n=1 Tax=Corallococcus sicarius TaxID=2316726 RepID=UPI001FCA2869|nr:ATP-binding protein [Corallococcus sicarius]
MPGSEAVPRSAEEDAAVRDVLVGGGDMGALMRSMDWSQTPLGPVKDWPQSLRTAVSTCLHSRFPMMMFWGPELVKLYNDAYRPMLGSKHPQAMGRSGREVWAEIWDILGPLVSQVREEGLATLSENQRLFLERNGFPEECYFTFSYSPIRDESGKIGGVLDTVVETTSQVLDARRLRTLQEVAMRTAAGLRTRRDTSARALEALATNPADLPFALLYLLDADGTGARLEARMGLEGDCVACPERVLLDDATRDPWPLARVARTGRAERVEGLRERFGALPLREDVPAPDSALVLPLARTGESDPAGLLVLGQSPRLPADASYRSFLELVASSVGSALASARAYEEAEQRAEVLEEVDRAKTAFFSNVSHEFRTPLTLMLGPLEDVLSNKALPLNPWQEERLRLVQRSSQRLYRLVNSLLDYSRLEAGRTRATFEPTDLAALTTELVTAFEPLVAKAGMRLVVDCPPLPGPVWVDRDLWEKIVLNLVSNAFKFTFEGQLAVRLQWRGDRVELSVQDTGTGIPEAELSRVFERFHQVEGARGRSHEGSGIGLALVHELVRLHGGHVSVVSTVGQGSTFTVALPTGTAHLPSEQLRDRAPADVRTPGPGAFVQEAAQWLAPALPDPLTAPAARAPEGAAGAPAPHGRVLLVDDNEDMRDYVRRALEGHFKVEAVADGHHALAVARERPPDVVLSDVMMPGLDGFGLLRELKSDPRTAHVPVILLSARAGEEAKVEGLNAGADDYLVKPFGVRELVARLEGTVNAAQARALREELLRALQLSETRYRLATRATKDAIWDWNLLTQEVIWNEGLQALFGYRAAEVRPVSTWWYEQIHPEDRERISRDIHGVIDAPGGSDWRGEYRFRRQDGTYAFVEDRGWVVRDVHGTAIRMVGALQDVTLRKQAQAQLQQRADFEQQLIGIVSHDLRNPVSAILLGAASLMRRDELDERSTKAVSRIQTSAERAHRMIRDLLDFTQARLGGGIRIQRRPTDLHEVLQGVVEEIEATHPDRELQVEGTGPGHGEWDPDRLGQMVQNLVTNALKYSPPDTPVRIQTRADADSVTLAIHNAGTPIPPERLEQLFQPLQRVSRDADNSGRSIGLGLYIVKQLVEAHGGTVTVASTADAGTTFTVRLPRTPPAAT